jgi:hypothetical protein
MQLAANRSVYSAKPKPKRTCMSKRYLFSGIAILMMSFFINGCFEFEERLMIKKDGSGTMDVEYWTMGDVKIDNDNYNFPEKEADIRKEVETKYTSNKVKLVDFNVLQQEKSRHVRFKVQFENVENLNELEQFQKNTVEFHRNGNKIDFRRTVYVNENDSDKEPDNAFEELIVTLVKEGLSSIKFRFEVETPADIDSTNATWTSGARRAIWKYTLADAMSKPEIEMTLVTK